MVVAVTAESDAAMRLAASRSVFARTTDSSNRRPATLVTTVSVDVNSANNPKVLRRV